jgi:pimeloyl-ACP methyl ester carboxylesterase
MPRAAVNGVELAYEDVGEGEPIVFSHEFGGDRRSWHAQVGYFSRWYRCVAYNHRGFPPSSVPESPDAYSQEILVEDLRALLDHLRIDRAHLVGLSMGGNVVLNFGLRYPDRCRSLVVAGTGSGTVDREQWQRDTERNIATLTNEGIEPFVERYGRGPTRLQLERKDPRGFAEFLANFKEHSALGSALTLRGVMLRRPTIFALKERLNAQRVPTLVVTGDEDDPCVEPALFMKREIPSAGLLVMPRTGHTLNLEEPQLFNAALLDLFHAVEHGRWPVH